ncbi:MAG: serine hydrolase, partial [Weissella confusa]
MTKELNVKMRKWLTGLLMTVVLAFGVATPSYAAIVTPTVDAQAAAVVDVQTGQVLADKNGNKRIPIASISKLLTVYLVERAIEAGKLTMDTPVSVPASIVAISTEPGLANVPLSTERTYT